MATVSEAYLTLGFIAHWAIGTHHFDGNTRLCARHGGKSVEGNLRVRRAAGVLARRRSRRCHLVVRAQRGRNVDSVMGSDPLSSGRPDPPVFTCVDPRSTPVGRGDLLHEIRPNDWDGQVAAEAELRRAVVDYLAGKSLSTEFLDRFRQRDLSQPRRHGSVCGAVADRYKQSTELQLTQMWDDSPNCRRLRSCHSPRRWRLRPTTTARPGVTCGSKND